MENIRHLQLAAAQSAAYLKFSATDHFQATSVTQISACRGIDAKKK